MEHSSVSQPGGQAYKQGDLSKGPQDILSQDKTTIKMSQNVLF